MPYTMNEFPKILILIGLIFICLATLSYAQDQNCIGFESLEDGVQYGAANGLVPGDELLTEAGVNITLEPFQYENGNTGFINVHVSNDPFINFSGEGLYVFPSNINMVFNFAELSETVTSVCFDFADGGGDVNLSVNDEPILFLADFTNAPTEIAPGVLLELSLDPNDNFPIGTLCLSGEIHSLLVGGQEMAIDNVCFDTQPLDSGCISFEELEGSVYGGTEGHEIGEIIYTESNIPLSLIPFQNFDWTTSFHQLQVIHVEDFPEFSSASEQFVRLDGISAVFNFSAMSEPVEMIMLDFYYDFGALNVSANGAPITTLATLNDGFINIGPGVNMEIVINDENPNMGILTFTGDIFTLLIGGNALRIDNVCTDPDCSIEHLEVSASDCDANNQFTVNLDFDYTLVSDTFALWLNGDEVSSHDYEDLPLVLGPFTGPTDQELIFEVKDRENPSCGATATLEPVICHIECDIRDMVAERTDCSNTGSFDISLYFIDENTSEHFDLFVNGDLFESYPYNALPIQFGPFTGTEPVHLLVSDASGNCAEDLLFEPLPCFDQCTISEVFAEAHDCNADGYFLVDIEIEAHNPGPLGYYVFGDGQIFGPFNYDETFVTVGPFEGDGISIIDFLVLDIANPACYGYYELGPINCNQQPCEIFELVVDPLECNNDGTYQLFINFEVENPGNEFFDVYNQEGEIIGYFPLAELPLIIPNFHGSGNAVDVIKVCINDHPDCCRVREFEAPNCNGGGDCHIFDVIAEAHPCTPNGIFYVDIAFEFENVGNEGYKILGNGNNYGTFSYNEPFPTLGPFNGDGETVYEFVVLDLQHPDCSDFAVIEPINCNALPCEIFDLTVTTLNCNNDGTYPIVIDFEVENPGNDFFEVFAHDGELIGYFPLNELPLTIQHFHPSGEPVDVIKVCINDHPDCCRWAEFEAPNCNGGECQIFEIGLDPLECDGDGTYALLLNLEHQNTSGVGFDVFSQGDFIGFYSYDDLPVTVHHFPQRINSEYDIITVCDNDNPNCCKTIEFMGLNCTGQGSCHIYEVVATPQSCTPNGVFYVDISFEFENVGTQGYKIQGNGHNYGTFSYNESFPTLGPFDGDGETIYEFVIIDLQHPECSNYAELGPIDCSGNNCTITELSAVPHCNDDGAYNLVIDFEVLSPGNEFFEVFNANGEYLGFFPIAELPITLPNYHGSAVVETVTVCINDVPECCYTAEFETPNCNGACQISDIEVDPQDCDGLNTYSLWLNFSHENTSGVGFDIFSGNHFIGFYSYDDLPIMVEHFPQRLNSDYDIITICDNDNPDCCHTIEFMGLDCNTEFCLEFAEYEGMVDAEQLAMESDSGLVIHQENGVEITATKIFFANDDGYLQNISVSPVQICDPEFVAAEGTRLYMEGGIRLDFSSFAIKPTQLSFDYAYCLGTDFINLGINNHDPFYGFFADAPAELNGIQIIVEPSNNTGNQGSVVLMGELENLVIGGIPLRIDNICFNGLPEDEEVWPGDGNSDNIAHHIDLLNIGLAFGSEGEQRDQLSISWEAMAVANWDNFFANGANFKHADCNGDGVINALDKSVIVQNYGLTHGNVADPIELPGTELDPPIFVDFSANQEWPTLSNFEVPIILGNEDHPVENVYGVAFTITVDPVIFNLDAIGVEYPDSWFGEAGGNVLTIQKIYDEEGKIEIALTRTDHQNVSGHGPIARLVGIIDDIAGIRADTKVDIHYTRAIDNQEQLILLNNPTQNVRIVNKKLEEQAASVGRIDLRRGTTISPNPAKDWIEVSNKYNLPIDALELFDPQGRPTGRSVVNDYKLSLAGLPQGVYMLKYQIGNHIIHEKIIKM